MIYTLLETERVGCIEVVRASNDKKALEAFGEHFNIPDWTVVETAVHDVEDKFLYVIHLGQDLEDFQYYPIMYCGTLAYTYETIRKLRLHLATYIDAQNGNRNSSLEAASENLRKIYPKFPYFSLQEALSVYFSRELIPIFSPDNEL